MSTQPTVFRRLQMAKGEFHVARKAAQSPAPPPAPAPAATTNTMDKYLCDKDESMEPQFGAGCTQSTLCGGRCQRHVHAQLPAVAMWAEESKGEQPRMIEFSDDTEENDEGLQELPEVHDYIPNQHYEYDSVERCMYMVMSDGTRVPITHCQV